MPKPYGVEFDVTDLIWMDAATKTAAAKDSIAGSAMSIDQARKIYLGLGPVPGGSSIWIQQQNYSIEALAERDRNSPFAKPMPPPPQLVKDIRTPLRAKVREKLIPWLQTMREKRLLLGT